MRKTIGWAAAAVLAVTGCGGTGGTGAAKAAIDEHKGPDVACGQCFVTGGGQLLLPGGQRVQVDVQAIPESGPSAGPGFGGAGAAATGHVSFQAVPANEGGLNVDALVDTVGSCTRESGVLRAVVSGTEPGGTRFTAVVTDGGEPANDTFAYTDSVTIPPTSLADGNFQVHELDRCEAPCGAGLCPCPDDHVTCEPCPSPTPITTTTTPLAPTPTPITTTTPPAPIPM